MPADNSQILGLPYIQPAQAQKHVTHNEAIRRLDVLVQLSVQSRTIATPPSAATDGDRYIVPNGATDAWSDKVGSIALHENGGWAFFDVQTGWRAFVIDDNEETYFDGTDWSAAGFSQASLQNVSLLGVGTAATAPNKLTVSADGTLLTNDGTDHRLAINKAATTDTASLLFQTGFTGHAEMGLTGTDGFDIRVSADGSSFTTAIDIDPANGVPTLPQGLNVNGPVTGTGIVGTVDELGGAIMEQGENANGQYVRFADGTQFCTRKVALTNVACTTSTGALFRSVNLGAFVFPAAFTRVDYANAAMTGSDTLSLRNNAIGARLGYLQDSDPDYWSHLVVLSPVSVAGVAADTTEFTLFAMGRWF
jgi:hypothetical protein